MSIPTYAEVTARVETDLPQATIETLIAAEAEDVESRYGPDDEQVDDLEGGGLWLFPQGRIEEVTSIVETLSDADTTLAADDYRLENQGRMIRRLNTGTNQRTEWGDRARITYTPAGGAVRKRVIQDLVHLAIQYNCLAGHASGEYSEQQREYQAEREKILKALRPNVRLVA